jgi:hypothetical protein
MLIRVTTYVTDLGAMTADFAISRIKGARRGISYLDEGFAAGSRQDTSPVAGSCAGEPSAWPSLQNVSEHCCHEPRDGRRARRAGLAV